MLTSKATKIKELKPKSKQRRLQAGRLAAHDDAVLDVGGARVAVEAVDLHEDDDDQGVGPLQERSEVRENVVDEAQAPGRCGH